MSGNPCTSAITTHTTNVVVSVQPASIATVASTVTYTTVPVQTSEENRHSVQVDRQAGAEAINTQRKPRGAFLAKTQSPNLIGLTSLPSKPPFQCAFGAAQQQCFSRDQQTVPQGEVRTYPQADRSDGFCHTYDAAHSQVDVASYSFHEVGVPSLQSISQVTSAPAEMGTCVSCVSADHETKQLSHTGKEPLGQNVHRRLPTAPPDKGGQDENLSTSSSEMKDPEPVETEHIGGMETFQSAENFPQNEKDNIGERELAKTSSKPDHSEKCRKQVKKDESSQLQQGKSDNPEDLLSVEEKNYGSVHQVSYVDGQSGQRNLNEKEMGGAEGFGNAHHDFSHYGENAKTNAETLMSPEQRGRAPAHEHPLLLSDVISGQGCKKLELCFQFKTSDGSFESTEFSRLIQEPSFQLLQRNNKLCHDDFFISLKDENVMVTNTDRVSTDDCDGWLQRAKAFIEEALKQVNAVFFKGYLKNEVLEYLKQESVNQERFECILSPNGQVLQLFTIGNDVIDQIVQNVVQAHAQHPQCRMIMKIHGQHLQLDLLSALAFQEHCNQKFPQCQVHIDLLGEDIVIVSTTDCRKIVLQELKQFCEGLTGVQFDMPPLSRQLLMRSRSYFQKMLEERGSRCWWRERNEKLELFACSKDIVDNAIKMIRSIIVQKSFPIGNEADWNKFLTEDLSEHSDLFAYESNPPDVLVAAFSDVASDIHARICKHFSSCSLNETSTRGSAEEFPSDEDNLKQERTEAGNDTEDVEVKSKQKEAKQSGSQENQEQACDLKANGQTGNHMGKELQGQKNVDVSAGHSGTRADLKQQEDHSEHSTVNEEGSHSEKKSSGFSKLKIPIPEPVKEFLQTEAAIHMKFLTQCNNVDCSVNITPMGKGHIKACGENPEKVKQILKDLFFHQTIAEDGEDVQQFLKDLAAEHPGKVKYCLHEREWHVYIFNDTELYTIQSKLEKFLELEEIFPVPCYVLDFFAYYENELQADLQRKCGKSASISVVDRCRYRRTARDETEGRSTGSSASGTGSIATEGDNMSDMHSKESGEVPVLLVHADRESMSKAKGWLHELVSEIETKEDTLELNQALFLEGIEAQVQLQQIQQKHTCQVGLLQGNHKFSLRAISQRNQGLSVCQGNIAMTDCDILVLPVLDGQGELPNEYRHILRRGLLSENLDALKSACKKKPVILPARGQLTGKTVIVISVPDKWDEGKNKERERFLQAYKDIFSACGEGGSSVAIPAITSEKLPLSKTVKTLLTVFFTDSDPTTCHAITIYTASEKDAEAVCRFVQGGIPKGHEWKISTPIWPRHMQKNRVVTLVGEIQKVKADVLVNSTDTKLEHNGPLSASIKSAAGRGLQRQCKQLYPGGIRVNEVAITGACNLKDVKQIYHIALSTKDWSKCTPGQEREQLLDDLRRVILRCLWTASQEQHGSIAFPTLGIGNLMYPCDRVAQTIFSTIDFFFREMPCSSLKKVTIVVFKDAQEAIQQFKAEEIGNIHTPCRSGYDTDNMSEMRMPLRQHLIQIVEGGSFNHPCVSDVRIVGEQHSPGGAPSSGSTSCELIIVPKNKMNMEGIKVILKKAVDNHNSVQIAADTLSFKSMTLHDLAQAVERVLPSKSGSPKLVSVIFRSRERARKFPSCFSDVLHGAGRFHTGKSMLNRVIVIGYRHAVHEALEEIKKLSVPPKYTKLAEHLKDGNVDGGVTESVEEELLDAMSEDYPASNQGSLHDPPMCIITIPLQHLKNVDRGQLSQHVQANAQCRFPASARADEDLVIEADFEHLDQTTNVLKNYIKMLPGQEGSHIKPHQPQGAEAERFEMVVDELECDALMFLLEEAFRKTVRTERGNDGKVTITSQTPFDADKMSLRREDIQLPLDDLSRLGDSLDTKSEGLEAFIKPLHGQGKVAIFAFDYNNITKAKHFVSVKAGKVKVTTRSRRRFDRGTGTGQVDTFPPQSLEAVSLESVTGGSCELTTSSGIKVLVYKTDITKLPVDAIVNAANGGLNHGGGVAAAIARAAGPDLEREGDAHITKFGLLKVTDVVPTTAGAMPCKKVLHAVGPRWDDYQDKSQCLQDLEQTVFNCLKTAHDLCFSSLAVSSISSAIFGVPRELCAKMYLSAIQSFDQKYGGRTSLQQIHFVDIINAMVTNIQDTFTKGWNFAGMPLGHKSDTTTYGNQTAIVSPYRSHPTDVTAGSSPSPGSDNLGVGRYGKALMVPPVVRDVALQNSRCPYQFHFLHLNLNLLYCKITEAQADAVVLWQYMGDVLRDDDSRKVLETLNSSEGSDLNRKLTEGAIERVYSGNKLYIFAVVPNRSQLAQEGTSKIVEKVLEKVDRLNKRSVAVTRFSPKRRASKEGNKDVEDFIRGVYTAVKNYTQRQTRSITEVHILDTEWETLAAMQDTVSVMIAVDRSKMDQHMQQRSGPVGESGDAVCVICQDMISNPRELSCKHSFCADCIMQWLRVKAVCPNCGAVQGVLKGYQPENGTMKMRQLQTLKLLGIDYNFPSGHQTSEHPHPGRKYSGTSRRAYLPDTYEGRKALMLLKVAFDRRLIFTIGQSATTGQDDVVIWNNIHHKTQTTGGPTQYGYPDPGYLTRLSGELAAKNVTEKDLTDKQKDFIQNPQQYYKLSEFSHLFPTETS